MPRQVSRSRVPVGALVDPRDQPVGHAHSPPARELAEGLPEGVGHHSARVRGVAVAGERDGTRGAVLLRRDDVAPRRPHPSTPRLGATASASWKNGA